jgi:hypothetical protein
MTFFDAMSVDRIERTETRSRLGGTTVKTPNEDIRITARDTKTQI